MKKSEIKILLVDDEPDIREIIGFNLTNEGYQVYESSNGEKAVKKAIEITPHLIIMDIMMPELDGISACEQIRSQPKLQSTVIMFLSARGEDFSYVAAFDAGADDYVTKPIKPKVLLSKVKGLLRRFKNSDEEPSVLNLGDLIVDKEEYKVTHNGTSFGLPRKEFELLFLLASRPNKVHKREKIMEKIWGADVVVGDRTIDVHIRKLREKVGEKFFKTVKGVGYKFEI
ncbi:MAG: DNA-binding response regulator [Flavobacteriaceae bacterium TMED120]|nr:MAG: DNA-binding response regulator [Flavobacteriaceae bacterium TMED120]CAI8218212.1 MAG: Transcriptional regulatory protein SrrA [Flavobacteriaceae bacterium]HCQ24969.1 DNA-binding response regulator [Flavobacteriaceae bacterium]|tara:strand:- start:3929 stop:4612 length:684 start_codon:yes stop_codon:yes gene_type:complete